MTPLTRLLFLAITVVMTGAPTCLLAASGLVFDQTATRYNYQSAKGAPISRDAGDPGSDGQLPLGSESFGYESLEPTARQFQSFISVGSVVNTGKAADGSGPFEHHGTENNAEGGQVVVVLRRAQIGVPYVSRAVAFAFGSVVPVPDTDENGVLLSSLNPPVDPEVYWLPEPYLAGGVDDQSYTETTGFYWSKHAGKVYAIQSGPIQITWVKREYHTTQPTDYSEDLYWNRNGIFYRLNTVNYIVSSAPAAETPIRRMYWTESGFREIGVPISVSQGLVHVNIVWNRDVPQAVSEGNRYIDPFESSPTDGSGKETLHELRTFWWDIPQNSLRAYNREGRVFVELLGDPRTDGQSREPLGIEIVELRKAATPVDITVELGEILEPPSPGTRTELTPKLVAILNLATGTDFTYSHSVPDGDGQIELYANKTTANLNDVLVHWLEGGIAGLRWPKSYGRYQQIWPTDVGKYSHYLRPLVADETEAQKTAVALEASNVPFIAYQDPLDRPRAKITPDSRFYTHLDVDRRAHRTLLRFTSGDNVAFERVFSWLGEALKGNAFTGEIVKNLDAWDAGSGVFTWPDVKTVPRLVTGVAAVGARIEPPDESGYGTEGAYLAGHIHTGLDGRNNLYNVNAYVDPLLSGFEAANQSSIIPVNAIPGRNELEVWWFRPNGGQAGPNAGNNDNGFATIYWPSIIGRYTLEWPANPREIVLASNDGSGALPSLEATGSIYVQNDAARPGYNPNEEHALMLGGQAFAMRDDLNITTGKDYSSEPYLLLDYTDIDGRPSMIPFRVLREKGEVRFNYMVEAGTILQPPMPLPLMDRPLGPKVIGQPPRSLNQEFYYFTVTASTNHGSRGQATLAGNRAHHFRTSSRELVLQSDNYAQTKRFIVTNIVDSMKMAGVFVVGAGFQLSDGTQVGDAEYSITETARPYVPTPAVPSNSQSAAGIFDTGSPARRDYTLTSNMTLERAVEYDYQADTAGVIAIQEGNTVFIVDHAAGRSWYGEVSNVDPDNSKVQIRWILTTPVIRKITIEETDSGFSSPPAIALSDSEAMVGRTYLQQRAETELPVIEEVKEGTRLFVPDLELAGIQDNHFVDWELRTEPVPASTMESTDAGFTLQDRKGNLWVYRGPHAEGEAPYMIMQFYYKTLPDFYFPSLPPELQPEVGTITPYLRSQKESNGSYMGDPVYGNQIHPETSDENAFGVVYKPVWPAVTPILQMAETLTVPKRGLPAVRGQSSLQVLYQQSAVSDLKTNSVVLHDPTRHKKFAMGESDGSVLGMVPASVNTSSYRGKIYFPNLPPHLSERFFLDPNDSEYGSLILAGEFKDETVGERYLLLNVLSGKDAESIKGLCLMDDPDYGKWCTAIENLSTTLEHFVENPQKPGTYIPGTFVEANPSDLADIWDDDVAVDSYALTATGPGAGYVTLIAGNGLAFTPEEEPVSLHVIRVDKQLYTGEVKPILSANPLAEKVTMQQVVDLAGRTADYQFEWRIASPVDGAPPPVYQTTTATLLDSGAVWSHIPFPMVTDVPGTLAGTTPARRVPVSGSLVSVSEIPYVDSETDGQTLVFTTSDSGQALVTGNRVNVQGFYKSAPNILQDRPGTVTSVTPTSLIVRLDNSINQSPDFFPAPGGLVEIVEGARPSSMLFRPLDVPQGNYSQLWISLEADPLLGVEVYLDDELLVTANQAAGNTPTSDAPSYISPLSLVYRLNPAVLDRHPGGELSVKLFSSANPGVMQRFDLKIEALQAAVDLTSSGNGWLALDADRHADGVRAILGEGADVQALADNYLIMRYRAANPGHAAYKPGEQGWSRWTTPALAEGWIKRVLAGINPFNQRITDLFGNQVNTDASILTQAGRRYEGDVALNLDSINDYGLIEIYETVLKRGRMLSIDAGINFGPANDALLLAAGYLNDLYQMVGNEAWADALNPTIGIGTADNTYGEIATASFSFKGQVPTLLEEELALLRGRDDFLQPGVEVPPFYNRLVWNYTRGIDAGEVIYAINYNVQENPNHEPDGIVNAEDAAHMFPMGHGDAYGHYLTALKGYYSLLLNNNFDWVPRIEAVNVLGKPVAVDYLDERKFASAAVAVARTGAQVFDLTWRKDYQAVQKEGWTHMGLTRANSTRQLPTTRQWGMDQWASRTSQGAYINWVVGNSMLPETDPNPDHEGIQKVDRFTVPELKELTSLMLDLQTALENAETGLSPLGVPENGLAFDINPNDVVGADGGSHFEQIYERARAALNNAVIAFDDAKDVTRLMRSEQDSLADLQNRVVGQELAYRNKLIELYGTPYPDDLGPGKTYDQNYVGPDTIHYMYVELPEQVFPELWSYTEQDVFSTNGGNPLLVRDIRRPKYPTDFEGMIDTSIVPNTQLSVVTTETFEFKIGSHGFFEKPTGWTSVRRTPGKLQQAASGRILAHQKLRKAINDAIGEQNDLNVMLYLLAHEQSTWDRKRVLQKDIHIAETALESAKLLNELIEDILSTQKEIIEFSSLALAEALPTSVVAGVASGGDMTAPGRSAILTAGKTVKAGIGKVMALKNAALKAYEFSTETAKRWVEFEEIETLDRLIDRINLVHEVSGQLETAQTYLWTINVQLREYDDAQRKYLGLLAEADRIQEEREIFRKRSAALVHGYRTRDAAFRIFRNEKLERYKTLFDLASRYALLAANAYDYETGLLGTSAGRDFVSRIINSRALGIVQNGEPQFAGSNTGDPGLSGALAELKADWEVLRGRLGINNPDAYGTTFSLRTELFRILPGDSGDDNWKQVLELSVQRDLLEDDDVRRHAMQISNGDGLPVPGLMLKFGTTIADGYNFFGKQLSSYDHTFGPSTFATKIFGAGVALAGYKGMDDPAANSGTVSGSGSTSPSGPDLAFLDPDAMSATPYIYLIPVGVDSMRSPPLGDNSVTRTWNVNDLAIPTPFNIGASDLASRGLHQSSDYLTEPIFAIRKHQAFRPVASEAYFSPDLYGYGGTLLRSQYMNNRLVGRSVWNSQWKIIIPGKTLLHDPDEGLERFIATVKDIKLHFVTYSYSGN